MLAEACEDCQVSTVVLQWREQQDFGVLPNSTTICRRFGEIRVDAVATRPFMRHGLPCAVFLLGGSLAVWSCALQLHSSDSAL
jgi:hypothetical protein